jgi:predicted ATPase
MPPPSKTSPFPGLKLRRLEIENYKRLDSLTVEFPRPRMKGDPDVMILGSQNGGGKTSALECVGLLYLAILAGDDLFRRMPDTGRFIDLADLLIKSGRNGAEISGGFEFNGDAFEVRLKVSRSGKTSVSGAEPLRERIQDIKALRRSLRGDSLEDAMLSLLAFNSEPLISPPLIHFNSYRKVQEGNPNLAAMVDEPLGRARFVYSRSRYGPAISTISAFKMEMLRSLLGGAELFEGFNKQDSEATVEFLNSLLRRYAGGSIEKLRPLPDNSLDFRITTGDGASFAFDGLSSGQKEIVSTLFLIWRHSQQSPCIVLIDEPELHLNAEWHADFVERLHEYGPTNQYVLATHSEQIFGCVDEDRRALLIPTQIKPQRS